MSTAKIIAGILTVIAASVAYHFLTKKEPERPPNDRVTEVTFAQLRAKMTEDRVEDILGVPHKRSGGDIVRIDLADSPDPKYAIEEQALTEGGNPLNLYQGRNKETIAVLFSGREGNVAAIEYRVADYPVIYRGPLVAQRSAPLRLTAPGRVAGTEEEQERRDLLAQYERRKELEKDLVASRFYSSSGPDPKPAEPDPKPADPNPPQPSATASAPGPSVPSSPQASVVGMSSASLSPEPLQAAPVVPAPVAGSAPAAPVKPAPATAGSVPTKPQPLKITLPSGKVLTDANLAFGVSSSGQNSMASAGGVAYQEMHPSGAVRCRYSVSKGKLNGLVTTCYENGGVESTACYENGQLNDVCCDWDETGARLLYAKYTRDSKDGVFCLFSKKWPWLVQEWFKGALKHEYLVKYVDEKPVVLDAAKPDEAEDEGFAQARQQLNELLKRQQDTANEIKQKARDQFKKDEQKAKAAKPPPLPKNLRP
jgi:antitoxin component YwqK of YwqJK toxin-antitoxin module